MLNVAVESIHCFGAHAGEGDLVNKIDGCLVGDVVGSMMGDAVGDLVGDAVGTELHLSESCPSMYAITLACVGVPISMIQTVIFNLFPIRPQFGCE